MHRCPRRSPLKHAGPYSAHLHFYATDAGLIPELEASFEGINLILYQAGRSLLDIAQHWVRFWDFPRELRSVLELQDSELDNIKARWKELFHGAGLQDAH